MNFLLILFLGLLLIKIIDGHKKGMVREIISLVSLIVVSAVVALLAAGITSYTKGEMVNVVIAFFLLAVISIVHHLLGVFFFSAKVITKLPVVHWLDKLLGIVVGILETVSILWTIYTFSMLMDMGMIGEMIMEYTRESRILVWFYEHNYLAHFIETLSERISFIQISF
ncbi:MAG: CvpA family protein [Roseburia sp.]|nr:CvpA family protein [Roseburia sp.]